METHRTRRSRATRALALVDEQAVLGRLYNHGENTVYAVANRPWVLRLHRDGYHDDARLQSELAVLDALPADLHVGRPVASASGDRLVHVDGHRASILTRLEGRIASKRPSVARCHQLGAVIAALHAWSRSWSPPDDFQRPTWDRAGLYGSAAVMGSLEDAGVEGSFATDLRAALDDALTPVTDELLVVHHDLHRGNVIWQGPNAGVIDWDDSGFGYPVVDLWIAATRLPPDRREALYAGYGGVPETWRALFPTVELALLARSVGWLHTRRDIPTLRPVVKRLWPLLHERGRAFVSGSRHVHRR